jgi:hypothetical protein
MKRVREVLFLSLVIFVVSRRLEQQFPLDHLSDRFHELLYMGFPALVYVPDGPATHLSMWLHFLNADSLAQYLFEASNQASVSATFLYCPFAS